MERLARGLSEAGFAVNRDLLTKMRSVLGLHVASFDPGRGELLSSLSSVDEQALHGVLLDMSRPEVSAGAAAFVPGPVRCRLAPGAGGGDGEPVQVFGAWKSEGGRRKTVLLLVPQAEIDRARWAAAGPALLAALTGAGAAVLLAWLLAASVARPVRRLAAEALRVAGGGVEFRHVSGGGREIAELSESLERMTAALERSRGEMVRSERTAAAGQMAAALAHEVRNPLTGALMTLEVLLAEEVREGGAAAAARTGDLRAVLGELQRLQLVVDELVSFARPSPPVFARVDLGELAAEVVSFLRCQMQHARVAVRQEVAPEASAARADRAKIKQVLVNLLLNAAQAMPRGGEVRVRVIPAPAPVSAPAAVWLEVSDNGSGVPPADADRIFEPFYTTRSGGAGLGLSVSRRLAEEHGGRLTCEPGTGAGALFRLELPVWGGDGA
jgi:signal transduction histidine kinase